MPCGPACRSVLEATTPTAHRPPVPCIQEELLTDAGATVQRQQPLALDRSLVRQCNTPPAPRELQGVAPALFRSHPTRSGILGSLPENRCNPETRCCRPPAIAQDPPSDTSV